MVREERIPSKNINMKDQNQTNSISLKQYAEESYLNYAMYVILDRALPNIGCLLYTSPSPRDATLSRMPSSA